MLWSDQESFHLISYMSGQDLLHRPASLLYGVDNSIEVGYNVYVPTSIVVTKSLILRKSAACWGYIVAPGDCPLDVGRSMGGSVV